MVSTMYNVMQESGTIMVIGANIILWGGDKPIGIV
jgi:hypothetical protein